MPARLKSAYILIVYLPSNRKIAVGKLGQIFFEKGIYLYVGSGGKAPLKRIQRHATKKKKFFWHIDFLTSMGEVIGAVLVESRKNLECELSRMLGFRFPSIEGFGCSDCSCKSHLFYLVEKTKKEEKDEKP